VNKSRATIRYGELSEAIYGARNIGGQSFGNPLGEIHRRTKAYNRRHHSHHPSINALVFNLKDTQPGIPQRQDPTLIWKTLEANGPHYVDRLSVLLGYHSSKNKLVSGRQLPSKDGAGPTGGGTRSPAIWEARHSPLVQEISHILRNDLKWTSLNGQPWAPDILLKSPITDRVLLVEVKPENSSHNIITAIGQIICYRSKFKDITSAIAAPGIAQVQKPLRKVIETYKIEIIDLDRDLKKQLEILCA
jgi:hypothetical protein